MRKWGDPGVTSGVRGLELDHSPGNPTLCGLVSGRGRQCRKTRGDWGHGLYHPWPHSHMPSIKPDLNLFTSPSSLKSSRSPLYPLFHRPLIPGVLLFFFSLIWCQTSIYYAVLTGFQERVTSYLGIHQIGFEGHPSKMLICYERPLTPLNSPLHRSPGALYGPIRHPRGRLTADLVAWQLKPYEGIFLLSHTLLLSSRLSF